MDNCCDWHGSLIAKNGTYNKENIYFCPECNSIWKTVSQADNQHVSEHVWGKQREDLMDQYHAEIELAQKNNKK